MTLRGDESMKKKIISFIIALLIFNCTSGILFNHKAIAQENIQNGNMSFSNNVKVELNGDMLEFDVDPMIINNRTLVPFRKILEALDAEVGWDGNTRTVTAIKNDMAIKLQINSRIALINKEKTELDVPAMIVEGRTFIPARFISEALSCEVDWNNNTRTVIINTVSNDISTDSEFAFSGITIGDSKEKVIKTLGNPVREDLSKYGFKWYIYNNDYSKYIQVGIEDNKVVGIYTNASNWKSQKGVMVGIKREEVKTKYTNPLSGIKKGNTIYNLDNSQTDTYLIDNYYTTLFYDAYNENTVTSVLLIEKGTEENSNGFFGKVSDELKKSYERQIFDLANAIRVRFNKKAYVWDNNISIVARKHSQDMSERNYFSHVNPDGKDPFTRMEENDIEFIMAAENIAAGQPSAIFAHEGWMNSKGHRKNILGNCKKLGVGLYFGGAYHVYYTQNFFTPRN